MDPRTREVGLRVLQILKNEISGWVGGSRSRSEFFFLNHPKIVLL